VNDNSGKCLDDYGFDTHNGAKIDQWSCNGGVNQEWAEFVGKQADYLFAPLNTPNTDVGIDYVLEVYHSSTANGGKVDLWSSNGSNTQA
jgi:hypothetical protein